MSLTCRGVRKRTSQRQVCRTLLVLFFKRERGKNEVSYVFLKGHSHGKVFPKAAWQIAQQTLAHLTSVMCWTRRGTERRSHEEGGRGTKDNGKKIEWGCESITRMAESTETHWEQLERRDKGWKWHTRTRAITVLIVHTNAAFKKPMKNKREVGKAKQTMGNRETDMGASRKAAVALALSTAL